MKTTVYAVRDSVTKERLSYRWRDQSTAIAAMRVLAPRNPNPLEVYRTTQDLVPVSKPLRRRR